MRLRGDSPLEQVQAIIGHIIVRENIIKRIIIEKIIVRIILFLSNPKNLINRNNNLNIKNFR